jgi:hypothetical protein
MKKPLRTDAAGILSVFLRSPVLLGMLLFCTALPLKAQSRGGFFGSLDYSLRGSMLVFPENNGNASAPMPILPSLGGSASYSVNNLFALELSLDLYGTEYDYDYTLGRPVPANQEFRTSFIIGSIFGFQPVLRFTPWGENITIRAYGGLSVDLRICLLAWDIHGQDTHQQGVTLAKASEDIFHYMWGGGRWFFPFVGAGMDFRAVEGIKLGFDLRAWFPVWKTWTGENLPAIEGFRFGAGFRATFR